MKHKKLILITAFFFILISAMLIILSLSSSNGNAQNKIIEKTSGNKGGDLMIKLPDPKYDSGNSIEKCLMKRRSVRRYKNKPLTLGEISQILWAAYGITQPLYGAPDYLRGGLRTAPSAGALYPLELYLVAGNVTGLAPGIYKYHSETHELSQIKSGDYRKGIYIASGEQIFVMEAPASIVYSAIYERTTSKYGERGRKRYVCMDLGHSAQNVCLQAVSLNIGACTVGAFHDDLLKKLVEMSDREVPLYIITLGRLRN